MEQFEIQKTLEGIEIVELKDKKLELRAYDLVIPAQGEKVSSKGLNTDPEHVAIWGIFAVDEQYSGDPVTLDTKSRISAEINSEEILDNTHACLFFKTPTISLKDAIFKTKIDVAKSAIKLEVVDGSHHDVGSYPRTLTIYLVCEKRK